MVAEAVTRTVYVNGGKSAKEVVVSAAAPRETILGQRLGISIDQYSQIKFSPTYDAKAASKAFEGLLGKESPNFENLHKMLHFEPGSQVAESFLSDAYQFVKGATDQNSRQVGNSLNNMEAEKIRTFYRERINLYLDAIDPIKQRFPRP
jgi:hypothetical protein